MSNLRVLAITLYSGEKEYRKCIEAINLQSYSFLEHFSIEFKPNHEAHCELYSTIEEQSDCYDIFIKIDADMILNDCDSIKKIVLEFENNRKLDHAIFSVFDWSSQSNIFGLHAFSNRVKWPDLNERLFVDPSPVINGEKKIYFNKPSPIALHMPNPSDYQSYIFGFHRALKIIQNRKILANKIQYKTQYRLLEKVWSSYVNDNSYKRYLVLLGAEHAFRNKKFILEKKWMNENYDFLSGKTKYNPRFLGKRWDKKSLKYYIINFYWEGRRDIFNCFLRLFIFSRKILFKFINLIIN